LELALGISADLDVVQETIAVLIVRLEDA